MTKAAAGFLMFTSGIIATLFIAYVVILHGLPRKLIPELTRALVFPRRLRVRVFLLGLVDLTALWTAAVFPGCVLVNNVWVLGQRSVGDPLLGIDMGATVRNQTIAIAILTAYILGHRMVNQSNFEFVLDGLRRKRKRKQRRIAAKRKRDAPAAAELARPAGPHVGETTQRQTASTKSAPAPTEDRGLGVVGASGERGASSEDAL